MLGNRKNELIGLLISFRPKSLAAVGTLIKTQNGDIFSD